MGCAKFHRRRISRVYRLDTHFPDCKNCWGHDTSRWAVPYHRRFPVLVCVIPNHWLVDRYPPVHSVASLFTTYDMVDCSNIFGLANAIHHWFFHLEGPCL